MLLRVPFTGPGRAFQYAAPHCEDRTICLPLNKRCLDPYPTGVRIRGALAVDAPAYLKGLWAACCWLLNTGKSGSQDSSGGGDSAMWVRRSVEDIHALAASGDYNAVVACVGAGVRVLAGVKDIVSLRFVRGQSLLYDNVKEAAVGGAGGEAGSTAAEAKGDGSKLLQSAVLCGQYVVPSTVDETGEAGGNGGKILLGSTQEHVMSGQQVREPSVRCTTTTCMVV